MPNNDEKKTILAVDDDQQMRLAMKEAVIRMGYNVELAENPIEALKKMDSMVPAMIITDMKMPRMDGLSFIKEVRNRAGNIPVLVITGFATVENAVGAMKEGACDYLMKPFSFDDLTQSINAVMSRQCGTSSEVVTDNENMKNILKLASSVAVSDMTVLILGESGTGKEVLARYIHGSSQRKDKPFVAVNCAAIPDNLLESELFGFEKGSFTGASERKVGKFELANGGTILLDEIGEMTATLQAKLLRVLQEREIDRIGGRQPVPVDVRVLATTNRDLQKEIQEGRFREDLYYRLSVFPLVLPPLRERPEDIRMLAEHFVRKFSVQLNKKIDGFEDDTIEFLTTRYWRGNIREFENAIQRAILIAPKSWIGKDDFMLEDSVKQLPVQNNGMIKDMEMDLILQTLEDTNGNKTKAAKLLGVSVRTIRNKLSVYGKNFPVE
ncbi:MAG: sigma-54-dependent Fis family transcriptional regulator [Nitrospira sp.]|nr:sigma-54-dependent Fis family transcriptional regulator [bacterium]MBL7049359.1 sigma-54-dependent Fis family transcriptional regulator [Nitrospira sp.]